MYFLYNRNVIVGKIKKKKKFKNHKIFLLAINLLSFCGVYFRYNSLKGYKLHMNLINFR